MKSAILALSIAGALAATQAVAAPTPADSSWYVSGAVGQSRFDQNGDFPGTSSFDRKDTSYNFAVGYQYSRMIGLEAGYMDFGRGRVNGNYLGTGYSSELKAHAPEVSAIFSAPLGDVFSVYGRLGVARTERSGGLSILGQSFGTSDKKTEAVYGVGAGWTFAHNLTGTLEYTKLNDTKVDAVNIGLRAGF